MTDVRDFPPASEPAHVVAGPVAGSVAGSVAGPVSGSQRVIYVAVAGNLAIAIAIAKFGAATLTGSSAMLAEGFHSHVDTGSELLLLHGMRRSRLPADEGHPFGYGKATYFWALIVALSVFSVGGGISVCEGIVSMQSASALGDPTLNNVVLPVSAVFEGFSWRVSRRELERCRRPGESRCQAAQRSMDVPVYTVFIEDSAALIGIAFAACGVWLSHHFRNPLFDPAASVAIGLVLIGAPGLLVRKSAGLLVGGSLDAGQIAQLRGIIAADPAVESVHHLLTMQLGPDKVLLTAAVRFERRLDLDALEQAIARLERAIKLHHPSIQQLFLESGALKGSSTSHRQAQTVDAPEAPRGSSAPPSPS